MSDALGLDHPLTRASAALDVTVRQLLVVGGMLGGSVAASLEHATWAPALAIASAVVLLGYVFAALTRSQTLRDRALDLIVEGRERLPMSVIQRQCRRLSRPRTRRTLARALDSMVEETLYRPRPASLRSRPMWHRPLIACMQTEIRAVAALLRVSGTRVRGVAFCERLVTNGCSALYGEDPAALRAALSRARALLELS